MLGLPGRPQMIDGLGLPFLKHFIRGQSLPLMLFFFCLKFDKQDYIQSYIISNVLPFYLRSLRNIEHKIKLNHMAQFH